MSYELQVTSDKDDTAYHKPITTFCLLLSAFCFLLSAQGQSNRLTNEKGQLLWQYTQTATIDEEDPKDIKVSFIFINGIHQTAISLRLELFYSTIDWRFPPDIKVEKDEKVEYVTINLAPNQYIILNYVAKNNIKIKELMLEKSVLLIMHENFEVRKEVVPEQRFYLHRK
jgi:hypothetical protein